MTNNAHKITATVFPSPKWVWQNEHCMWVSVPKNANMQIRKICTACGMPRVKHQDLTHSAETVCVLRDPRTRLISALGEFKKRKRRSENLNKLLEMLLDDASGFDEHLEPQSFYISGIVFTHILRFEDLHNELNRVDWFSQYSTVIDKHINSQRLTSSKHHKSTPEQLAQQNQQLVDQIINKYYRRDLEIWQNRFAYQGQTL